MPGTRQSEVGAGIAELSKRLAAAGIAVLKQERPWPNRTATYFVLGRGERNTDIVLSDEFVSDLPGTPGHQKALDSYASALSGRIKCGDPNVFFCLSGKAVRLDIQWPVESSIYGSAVSSGLRVHASEQSDGRVALCFAQLTAFSFTPRSMLDEVMVVTNRVREAVDNGSVAFYDRQSHPESYQKVELVSRQTQKTGAGDQAERFVAGKVYILGFAAAEAPCEVWISDPWDAAYLNVSTRRLTQAAHKLRAQGLVEFDPSSQYARAGDKFVVAGWPAALASTSQQERKQEFSLSRLPKKDHLIEDLNTAAKTSGCIAVIVVDLDNFKTVNDTKGHTQGDACLERIVRTIGNILGRKGTLYRWGGDEFAVILPDFSTDEGHSTAERIRRAIEEAKPGGDILVTASIGLAGSDHFKGASPDQLLEAADKAMYVSKKGGKNRVSSWPVNEGSESGTSL